MRRQQMSRQNQISAGAGRRLVPPHGTRPVMIFEELLGFPGAGPSSQCPHKGGYIGLFKGLCKLYRAIQRAV